MQKNYLFISILILLSFQIQAQTPEYRTYIYKITDKQAQEFYQKKEIENPLEYCQNPIGSFLQRHGYHKKLPNGHYLFFETENRQIKYKVESINYLEVKLFDNEQYAEVLVHDSLGNIIENAEVFLKTKKLKYNKTTKTYWINSRRKEGLLTIKYQNTLSFFKLKVEFYKSKLINKLLYRYTPAYKVWNPTRDIYNAIFRRGRWRWKNLLNYIPFYYSKSYYGNQYKGYFVAHQPKYRPNDTLKLKAFITTQKAKPYTKNLYIYLNRKKIGKANSYRKGAYTFEFVLEENLKLDLDYIYDIELKDEKNNTVKSTSFVYEDYELDNNTYNIRAEKEEIYSGENLILYTKGTDANDLNVLDGTLELTLLNKSYPYPQFEEQTFFIPDTIWKHQQKLDIVGETKIIVPDSIFPKASFSMQLLAKFSNADGETKEETLTIGRREIKERLVLSLENGFFKAKYLENNQSKMQQAILKYDNISKEISLPYQEKINPFVWEYQVESGKLHEALRMNTERNMISIQAYKTRDSLFVWVDNPHKIDFHYSLFLNGKIIEGVADSLNFKSKSNRKEADKVVLQYVWAGTKYEAVQEIPFYEKMLKIAVNQDLKVYPGQESDIELSITDQKQNPMENVDVLAFAYTEKFRDAKTPQVDYLGKPIPLPMTFPAYQQREVFKNDKDYMSDKEFELWNAKLGLDSLLYYRLLYPKNGFYQTTIALDNIPNLPKNIKPKTQFAPFVVSNGFEQKVHLIYVDEQLVYVGNSYQTYALPISAGYHNIKIVTEYHLIQTDRVFFEKGKKTIFSVNVYKENPKYSVEKYWGKWAEEEENILGKRTLEFANNYKKSVKYLVSGNTTFYGIGSGRYHFAPFSEGDTIYCYNGSEELLYKTVFKPSLKIYYDDKIAKFQNRKFDYPQNKKFYTRHDRIADIKNQIYLDWEQIKQIPLKKKIVSTKKEKIEYDYQYKTKTKAGFGKLSLKIPYQSPNATYQIRYIALSQNNSILANHIYPEKTRVLHQIREGKYNLFIIADSNRIMQINDIDIKSNGTTYLKIDSLIFDKIQKVDVNNLLTSFLEENQPPKMYIEYHKDLPQLIGRIKIIGKVLDEDGNPFPGASIFIKSDQSIGTLTNTDGTYKLEVEGVTEDAIVAVLYSGYQLVEFPVISPLATVRLVKTRIGEVIVTGYREVTKESATIQIRGISSISSEQVLQGQVSGVVNPTRKFDLSGIYGSRAPDYSYVDSLVKAKENALSEKTKAMFNLKDKNTLSEATLTPAQLGSIRNNFRDYAYWKPQLRTDENGKVKFKVKYPDDVTKWRNYFIAMDDKKHSGFTSTSVLAYKDVMGQLAMPRFLTEGDTVQVIGKSLNYGSDTLAVKTVFEQNNKVLLSKKQRLANSLIDKLPVIASEEDSLTLKYYLETEENYQEGEARSIPIYPQGTLETKGAFLVLAKDTSFSISAENPKRKLQISALANDFEVFLNEITHVRKYEHLCNEQRASKIKTLLAEQKIRTYLGEKFKYKKLVQKLVTSLEKIQNTDGTWGWWENLRANYWISSHVVEALLEAEKAGYQVKFKKALLANHLGFRLQESHISLEESIRILSMLKNLGESPDYEKHLKKIERKAVKNQDSLTIEQKIKLIGLRQKLGLKYDVKDILKAKKETMLGQMFWGKEGYHIYNNAIQTSLQVYRILAKEGKYAKELQGIKNYIFSRHRQNTWRNTFESAQIIETLLPDMLKNTQKPAKSFLYVNGKKIENYPFEMEFFGQEKVEIRKEGDFPIYFSHFQQDWNREPTKNEKDFKVNTYFEGKPTQLEVSEKIDLIVEIENDKLADFVMIEVPIPAGCSYAEKPKNYYSKYHREYYKNKACIFTEKLPIGKHSFKISLMPRYAGSYTLNPARVELMYFPVFFGREGLKKVSIQQVEASNQD